MYAGAIAGNLRPFLCLPRGLNEPHLQHPRLPGCFHQQRYRHVGFDVVLARRLRWRRRCFPGSEPRRPRSPESRMVTPTESPRWMGASPAASSAEISPASTLETISSSFDPTWGCFKSVFFGMAILTVGPSAGSGVDPAPGDGPSPSGWRGGSPRVGRGRGIGRRRRVWRGRGIGRRGRIKLDHNAWSRLVVSARGRDSGRCGEKHRSGGWRRPRFTCRIATTHHRQN